MVKKKKRKKGSFLGLEIWQSAYGENIVNDLQRWDPPPPEDKMTDFEA